MKYVYLAIFIIFTALHLYASQKRNKGFRNATKGLILISIMGFYCESMYEKGNEISWWLIAALLTSWVGDMFLIPKGTKWFVIGGFSFWASHVLFIIAYTKNFEISNVPIWVLILAAAFFVVSALIIFSKLKKYLLKILIIPMFLYLVTNGLMNCFAIYQMVGLNFSIGAIITAIGALLFFISDSSLFFIRFNKTAETNSHFLPMLTYSVGEFLIVLGLILI